MIDVFNDPEVVFKLHSVLFLLFIQFTFFYRCSPRNRHLHAELEGGASVALPLREDVDSALIYINNLFADVEAPANVLVPTLAVTSLMVLILLQHLKQMHFDLFIEAIALINDLQLQLAVRRIICGENADPRTSLPILHRTLDHVDKDALEPNLVTH